MPRRTGQIRGHHRGMSNHGGTSKTNSTAGAKFVLTAKPQNRYPGETDKHFRQRCHRGYVNCAEAFHLFRFTWQIFGHVTFAQLEISRHKRVSMLFAAIASTFDGHGLEFKNAVWVRCEELGKLGRSVPHIHFLIAAIPNHIDLEKFCVRMAIEW